MSLIPAIKKNIRWEETALTHNLILRFLEAGSAFPSEVEVKVRDCFAFRTFRLSPNNCLRVYINHATFGVQCLEYEFMKKPFA